MPYSCLRMISEQSAEWQYYGSTWEVPGHADRGASDVLRYAAAFMGACPSVESYADFIVFKNKQFVERHGLGGLYHDWTVPVRCRNEAHGCGWRDADGKLQGRYPIFAARDLYRRIYAMLKDQPHETFMMGHMSARVLIPMLSFCDAYLDGEQFRRRVTDDYTEALPLDAFRAEFMGKQWGVIPYFLPELAPEAHKEPASTRHLLSLTLLHDTPVWAIWCNSATVAKVREALDDFGYADAEFLGYWDNGAWLSCEQEDVKVSAYRREGRALLVVSNLSAEAQKVSLKVNLEELGVPGAAARNAETGEEIAIEDGTFSLEIARRDLALIRVRVP